MSSTSEQLRPRVSRVESLPVSRWRDTQTPHNYGIFADRLPESVSADVKAIPTSLHAVPELQKDVSSRFGRRLRQLRQERELTQSGMARRFGIDRSFISDVERGRKSISLPMLEVLALGLDLSLSELFRDL